MPKLADLCCKAGGAARGYDAAGFEVEGYDFADQRRYPFKFFWKDVLELDPVRMGNYYDAFHASPSCKGYTALRTAHNAKDHARQIPDFVEWLNATGKPWVLENVEEAGDEMLALLHAGKASSLIVLCGSMFDLGAQGAKLQRHRLFMANFPLVAPECRHDSAYPVVGVYGGHARIRAASRGGRKTKDAWPGSSHRVVMAQALGIPVGAMSTEELSEAIPPVYTEFVGRQLRQHLAK